MKNFDNVKGTAIFDSVPQIKLNRDINSVRIIGGILPRYVYWVTTPEGKQMPIENITFNRNTETFTSTEIDWVKKMYPDLKSRWSYCSLGIDTLEPKPKIGVINWKKGLLQQVLDVVPDLGSPSDPDTGYDIVFSRKKTGPASINVAYALMPLKLKKRALSEEEREVIAAFGKTIDEVFPQKTPEEVKALLDKISGDTGMDDQESIADID